MDLSSLTGGGLRANDPADVDHYTVRYQPPEGGAGWRVLDEWDQLDEPVDRQTFEWNEPDPDPGIYRLFAVADKKLQRPADEFRWSMEIEGELDEEPDPEHVADRAAQKAVTAVQQDQAGSQIGGSVLELAETPEDLLKLMSMFNEDWLREQGNHAVARAWGLAGDNELGFEDYKENPLGAFFFDSYKEPQQLREFGQSLGAGGSAFLDGLLMGAEDPEEIFADEIAEAERKAEEAANREPDDIEPRESRTRTLTPEDFGIDLPEPSAAAEALDDTSADETAAQERPEHAEAGIGTVDSAGAGGTMEPNPGGSATADDDGTDADDPAREGDIEAGDVYGEALTDEDIAKAMEGL